MIIKAKSKYQDKQKYVMSPETVFVIVTLKSNAYGQEIALW